MNEDTRDLVRKLCKRAGMIMEDASLLAVTMPAGNDVAADAALARLRTDVADVAALLSAATALKGRSG